MIVLPHFIFALDLFLSSFIGKIFALYRIYYIKHPILIIILFLYKDSSNKIFLRLKF